MTVFLEYFCGKRKTLTAQADTYVYLFSLSKDHESRKLLILLALKPGCVYSQTYSSIFRKKNSRRQQLERPSEAQNKTENNGVMDYTETPENDDFRDREFDCFLEEKKKVTGRGKERG